jgi:flagellar protein FlbD
MIYLHRLNGTEFALNAELVEQIEKTPDTVITTTKGNNIVVKESLETVVERIVEYRRRVAGQQEERVAAKILGVR